MECQNGILLPKMVKTPISQEELLSSKAMNWEDIRGVLTALIRDNEDKGYK